MYEANRETNVAMQTQSRLSKKETISGIVAKCMDCDILAPLKCSLQVDVSTVVCCNLKASYIFSCPWFVEIQMEHSGNCKLCSRLL